MVYSFHLVSHGFTRGKFDQTLFIKKEDGELVVTQIYIDDIIFGSTKDELAHGFLKTHVSRVRDEHDWRVDSLPWIVDLSTRFKYILISIYIC